MTTPKSSYREITLTKGQTAIVDSSQFDKINASKWFALWSKNTKSYYAARHTPMVNGKRTIIYMHRQVLGIPPRDRRRVDHENHNTLDNTVLNLRIASNSKNCQNRRIANNNTSGHKGVYQHKSSGKWIARIFVDGKRIYLGSFNTKEEASLAYQAAALKYFGKFACLG